MKDSSRFVWRVRFLSGSLGQDWMKMEVSASTVIHWLLTLLYST